MSKMQIQVIKIANQSKGTSGHKVFCGNLTNVSQVIALKGNFISTRLCKVHLESLPIEEGLQLISVELM